MKSPAASSSSGRRGCRWWAAACVILLSACQPAADPGRDTVRTGTARPRIVSLNPCTDAILAQVTSPGQLLAISHYSHDPSATSMDLDVAARFGEVSQTVEDIASFSPDIVVGSTFLPPATAQALTDLGYKIVREPIPTDLQQATQQIRRLARVAGNGPKGDALVRRIDKAVHDAAPAGAATPIPALLWESGGIVAGDGTLIADLMTKAGFVNSAAARGLSQADFVPLERMVAMPPRVLFTAGAPASDEDRMLSHPALEHVPYMTRMPLDRSLIWCGGPTIPRALARFVEVRKQIDRSRLSKGQR